MNFQILKLIVWPKRVQFAPRIVEFKTGKVNVITGASRTGKSAIIPIIDYCLASSDCIIPIDTIRDHATWYGLVVQLDDEQILFARKVPVGNRVSNEFYVNRGSNLHVPSFIAGANESLDGVKQILNAISSVPYFSLSSSEEGRPFEARLGFRDLMALVFQSQDIVANQNIIFYKTHAHEHRERLRNWFPFILGAESLEVLIARQRIQVLEKKLSTLRRELQKSKAASKSWSSNMLTNLKTAKEYGLVTVELNDALSDEQLLSYAKDVLVDIPDYNKTTYDSVRSSIEEVSLLEKEEDKLSGQIGVIKKRLTDLRQLKNGMIDFEGVVRQRADRLHISKWLKDVSSNPGNCVACGAGDHKHANDELQKISSIFENIENKYRSTPEISTSFLREEERLKSELEAHLETRKDIQEKLKNFRAKDKEAQLQFQNKKNLFLYLGHLKASVEMFVKASDDGELIKEITELEGEYSTLSKKVSPESLKAKLDVAVAKISQGMLSHLKTLDVEEKYRKLPPRFSTKDLNLQVLSDDGHWHFLAEVGSASNWVSFHIALMCSLQEFFLELPNACVPSFVIFDQPSQVYFPKVKKAAPKEGNDQDIKFDDEDVAAVKNMFETLAKSVTNSQGKWQGIILDHAEKSIYGQIDGVYEVEEWRNGLKLIPNEWIS